MALNCVPTVESPAPGISAQYFGQAGSAATYYYWAQVIYPWGSSLLSGPSPAVPVSGLDRDNFVALSCTQMAGAIAYYWFRTTTTTPPTPGTAFLTVTSNNNFNDRGSITPTACYPSVNGVFTARMYYDFAVDGGAVGNIIPVQSDTIPKGALVINGVINSPTAASTGSSPTISVGTSAGSGTASLKALTASSSYSTNAVLVTLASTAPFKMTAAGQLQISVAVAALTAGVIEVIVTYVMPVNQQ